LADPGLWVGSDVVFGDAALIGDSGYAKLW
jgi:hypothetical protein